MSDGRRDREIECRVNGGYKVLSEVLKALQAFATKFRYVFPLASSVISVYVM